MNWGQNMNRCTGPVLCTCPITAPHNPGNPVCPRNQPTAQNPNAGVPAVAGAEGTHLCTCNQYPHAPACGVPEADHG